jgi:hypothetical protein
LNHRGSFPGALKGTWNPAAKSATTMAGALDPLNKIGSHLRRRLEPDRRPKGLAEPLSDESLEASENLPEPDVIASEIVEDLRATLEQFETIEADRRARVPAQATSP